MNSHFPGQQLLHEAALLLVKCGALLAKEAELGVGGVENDGDGALFVNLDSGSKCDILGGWGTSN